MISSHYLPIPPGLKPIPSQLPQVFTINKVLSMEHLEIRKKIEWGRFHSERRGHQALQSTLTRDNRQASDVKEALHGRQPMFYLF